MIGSSFVAGPGGFLAGRNDIKTALIPYLKN